jgi:hypothetical protein
MLSELCVLLLELLLPLLLLLLPLAVLYASELLSDDSLDIIYLSIFNRVYILGTPIPDLFVEQYFCCVAKSRPDRPLLPTIL